MAGRQYPHSDKIQPRFAAWLWSIGAYIEPDAPLQRGWQMDFMSWIRTNIREAYKRGNACILSTELSRYYSEPQLQVVDHDGFTDFCWDVAEEQRPRP